MAASLRRKRTRPALKLRRPTAIATRCGYRDTRSYRTTTTHGRCAPPRQRRMSARSCGQGAASGYRVVIDTSIIVAPILLDLRAPTPTAQAIAQAHVLAAVTALCRDPVDDLTAYRRAWRSFSSACASTLLRTSTTMMMLCRLACTTGAARSAAAVVRHTARCESLCAGVWCACCYLCGLGALASCALWQLPALCCTCSVPTWRLASLTCIVPHVDRTSRCHHSQHEHGTCVYHAYTYITPGGRQLCLIRCCLCMGVVVPRGRCW